MTSHGRNTTLHRIAAPKKVPVLRRIAHYLVKSQPGPHPFKESVPLLVALRDILGMTRNKHETKTILEKRKVLVDGKARTKIRFPVGLMDVVSFPDAKKHYRVLFGTDGKIRLKEIVEKNSEIKLCKISNKSKIKGGKIQLNLHDGRNLIVEKDNYNTGDTLIISIPTQEIKKHLPNKKGVKVYITDGKHIGETATVTDVHPMAGSYPDRVVLQPEQGDEFETLNKYVFVIGKDKPEIEVD